jgi:oligopeptide transport system substrate-binding protein
MSDSPERQAIIDRMVEIVRHDGPWIWGYHPTAYMLHHEWYKNTKANLMARNTLKYKDVDPLKRKEMQIKWNRPVVFPILILCICLLLSAIPAWMIYSKRQRASIK